MNLTQKISQMTPKGADLEATDLIEVSTIVGGSYVTKSITGQELIDAIPLPPTGLTVGTTPISSGVVGRVLFQGTGNVLQQSSSLFWDNAKDSLGVLNPTPFSGLTASGIDIGIYNTIGSEGNLSVRGFSSLGGISRSAYGAVGSNYYLEKTTGNLRRSFGDLVSVMEMASGGFQFKTASAGAVASLISLTELMRINANGNVLINTTTDAGFRLDVNGTARMGTLRLLNTSDTLEFANTLVRIRRVANTMFLDAFNGFTFFDSTSSLDRVKIFANGNFAINTTTDAGFRLDVNGTARLNASSGNDIITDSANVTINSYASSTSVTRFQSRNAAAALVYKLTIPNQTNTAAIFNGGLRFSNLPTSSAGLSAGDIWNDGGTLKIV